MQNSYLSSKKDDVKKTKDTLKRARKHLKLKGCNSKARRDDAL